MESKILKNRHKQIRNGMSSAKVNCLILTEPANVTYVTGFSGDDSLAIILPKAVFLVTDSRYAEQAKQECRSCKIIVRTEGMAKTIAKLLPNRHRLKIGIEKSASLAEFESLKKQLKTPIKSVANLVETVRRTKDETEIAAIKAASQIAAKAFDITIKQIKRGMTENELAGILDFEIRKLNGQNAFETIAAFGPNASRPHHKPTNRKLQKNDTILLDFGAKFAGYCCDVTRCLAFGKTSPLYGKVYFAVKEAQLAAIKMVRAGVDIKKVDIEARLVLKKCRLPVYGHGTGHGLGLEVHEMPYLSPRTEGPLQQGDIITIEPGVYMPGKLGVRIEDDILVTKAGCIVLTEGVKNR
jgi:Xaa-Pro aminopeptidase